MKKVSGSSLANPILKGIFPLLSILPGIALSMHYASINFLSCIMLITFVYLNYLTSSLLQTAQANRPPQLALGFSIVNIVLIVILSINHSFFLGINLLLYTAFIYLRPLFRHYDMSLFYVLLLLFFQLFVLNISSFYINANFISTTVLFFLIPLIVPMLMFQEVQFFKKQNHLANILIFISIGITIATMVFYVHFWALLAIFIIPIVYYLNKHVNLHFIHANLLATIIFLLVFIVLY